MPRKRKLSSSPLGHAAAVADDATAMTSSIKCSSLIFVSIALSSMLIHGRGALLPFAEAVDSPTLSTTRPPNLETIPPEENSERGNDNRSEAVDRGTEKIIRTIHASEEDANVQKNENLYTGEKDGSPSSSKMQKSPPANGRKGRQKQRQRQQQQQTEIEIEKSDAKQQQQQMDTQQQQHQSTQAEYDAYMHWCHKVLGISSVVEIAQFEYLDHLQMHWDENDEDDSDSQEFDWLKPYSAASGGQNVGTMSSIETMELPTKMVRGLAATHDIQVGDIVISIPLYSLLSVPTTIDHDPVLSRILGPDARITYGWTNTAEYELPLLVLAVLYHRSLGQDSPISHYIEILLGTPTDSFPFLWSDKELRGKTGGDKGEEVRKMARGIRGDLYEMYDSVMGTLVKEKPEWFAPPPPPTKEGDGNGEEGEWIYSYENFKWAFALVISRHHYLPIQDFDDKDDGAREIKRPTVQNVDSPSQPMQEIQKVMHETLSSVSEVVPPANQPTDNWVDLAVNEERVVEDELVATDDDIIAQSQSIKHSFLAPLADLINFGPPCLTGSYNADDHAFDLVATCPFKKGQEVTFWYSSDCSDVIIANFGFLHPLVPPCDTTPDEDWEKRSDEWMEATKMRERELWEAYRETDLLKEEMAAMESQLVSCECKDGEKKRSQQGIDSTPAASGESAVAEADRKLRIRGRANEQAELNREMMEELG